MFSITVWAFFFLKKKASSTLKIQLWECILFCSPHTHKANVILPAPQLGYSYCRHNTEHLSLLRPQVMTSAALPPCQLEAEVTQQLRHSYVIL